MKKQRTPHEKYAEQVRAAGRSATPYRIGLAVSEAGDDLPSPYSPGSRGDHNYLDGVERGRIGRMIDLRAKQLYHASTANDPTIHCNRFPAWDELPGGQRWEWRKKAMADLGC